MIPSVTGAYSTSRCLAHRIRTPWMTIECQVYAGTYAVVRHTNLTISVYYLRFTGNV